jgi:AP-2 complex subunit alpha
MSLLLGLASHSKQLFEPIVPYVISVLNRLTISASCPVDYLYYRTPCPWLQVKCLRFLQYYKLPTDETHQSLLLDVLRFIAEKTGFSDHSANKSNADHAILFEVINLAILLGADAPEVLKEHVCTLLGRFIALNDANIKYLGLDAMTRLAKIDGPKAMQVHQTTVLELLKDTDVSVRKRALDLVYVLTDGGNARVIVGELLANLAVTDSSIKEDFVVKIAILAENFSHDLQWYVSTMVQVLQVAGDFVAEAVWYRVVQIITNHPEVHESAAVRLMASIEPKYAHDSVVAVAAYLLGEIGVTICELPGMSGHDQFLLLNQHFLTCSAKVQSIILSAFMKLLNLYPEQTADEINAVFNKYSTHVNLELQQRSCEYLALPSLGADVMENVMNPMPPFEMQDKSRNVLLTMVGTSHEKGVNADMTAFTEVVRGGKDPTISAAATTSASSSPSMPELKKVLNHRMQLQPIASIACHPSHRVISTAADLHAHQSVGPAVHG